MNPINDLPPLVWDRKTKMVIQSILDGIYRDFLPVVRPRTPPSDTLIQRISYLESQFLDSKGGGIEWDSSMQ